MCWPEAIPSARSPLNHRTISSPQIKRVLLTVSLCQLQEFFITLHKQTLHILPAGYCHNGSLCNIKSSAYMLVSALYPRRCFLLDYWRHLWRTFRQYSPSLEVWNFPDLPEKHSMSGIVALSCYLLTKGFRDCTPLFIHASFSCVSIWKAIACRTYVFNPALRFHG